MTTKSAVIWSVIAAAFVGPGTVATAAYAGSQGGWLYVLPLLGALLIGYLLMEMAARITLVTGRPLGFSVRQALGGWVTYALFGGILLGCCAYEAGNLMGGFVGLQTFVSLDRWWVLVPALLVGVLLLSGNVNRIGKALALIVILMGAAFLYAGMSVLFSGGLAQSDASTSLQTSTILSLFGTTIVPYNFMLAAGLGPGQSLRAMRGGLGLSFLVGGLITLGILFTGSAIEYFDDFNQLAAALHQQIGPFAQVLMGIGLFAAGISSAITAPLAAAMAGKTLFEAGETDAGGWSATSLRFRATWGLVLLIGSLVAALDLSIIPVILAAQFVNALLLPFLAALVLLLGNHRGLLGVHVNRTWQNVGGLLVFAYLTFQSSQGLLAQFDLPNGSTAFGVVAVLLSVLLAWRIHVLRGKVMR